MKPTHNSLLPTPSVDLATLTDQLGQAWGVSCGVPVTQYLAWCEKAGIFSILAERGSVTVEDVCSISEWNAQGVDALLCILASLKLVNRTLDGICKISSLTQEYLIPKSPYYIGDGLFLDCKMDIPVAYLRNTAKTYKSESSSEWPVPLRLRVQHSRNFPPSVVASRTGEFANVQHLIDIAGGAGVLAIPLALDNPDIRITLVELPEALEHIREVLVSFGVEQHVELVGIDVFNDPWSFGPCDGVYFGNFFHFVDDAACSFLAHKSFEILPVGGKVWLHEVLFNEDRNGPLLAALWNANMIVRRPGARQRTAAELLAMLHAAGFVNGYVLSTSGHFSLVAAQKPEIRY